MTVSHRFLNSQFFRRFAVLLLALAWSSFAFGADIHEAAASGDLQKVKALLKRKPNLVSSKDDQGETPLHLAAQNGHVPVVQWLLAKKARVNVKDDNGATPLHLVADKGRDKIANLLLMCGADVNAKDNNGDTPLHAAAAKGHKMTAGVLMAYGANLKAKDNAGLTPSQLAGRHGHKDMVEPLLGRYKAYGTGFFVTDDGYLVSNNHVVNGAVKIQVVSDVGTNSAIVVKVDTNNDLALLKVEGHFSSLPVAPSANLLLGTTVATVGFPLPTLQGFSAKLAKGEIASLAGMQDDARYFQISVPVQPGNSGGALVEEHGNVVGIVSAKLSAFAVLMATGEMPEDVNYAVKSGLLLDFLKSVPGVSGKLKPPNTAPQAFPEMIQSVQKATVQLRVVVELP